jgi:D-alanyl-D-alanine carboxypeptidase
MSAWVLRAGAALWVLTSAGCSGTGRLATDSYSVSMGASCQSDAPYQGQAPHATLPSALFPAAPVRVDENQLLPEALRGLLDQEVLDILHKTGAPALSAAITVPGLGRWNSTQGLAQTTPAQEVTESTEFYWGSVAKALTAVLVFQLVEEGRLSLDDPVSRWFPQLPQAQHMTLSNLLSHTSGLQTNAKGGAGLGLDTPSQQLATLTDFPLLFCPGTHASYSNLAYLLLGLVVEATEQQPFYTSVQRRIATPLGLRHLRALRPGEDAPEELAMPHAVRIPVADPGAWTRLGAGNVVARAEDMVVFWRAVLSGRLLTPATVQSQWAVLHALGPTRAESNQGISWFGSGVMLTEWTDSAGRPRAWLGHFGGIPTANAALLYDHTVDAYAAVAVNSAVSSAAVANALIQTVWDWRIQHASLSPK